MPYQSVCVVCPEFWDMKIFVPMVALRVPQGRPWLAVPSCLLCTLPAGLLGSGVCCFCFRFTLLFHCQCPVIFLFKKKYKAILFAYYCRDIFQSFEFHESEIPTSHEADLSGGACTWVKPRLCSWDAWILLLSSQTGGSLSRDLCAGLGCVHQSGIAQLFCFQISGNGIFFTSLIFWWSLLEYIEALLIYVAVSSI